VGAWSFVWGGKPTKATRDDGTGTPMIAFALTSVSTKQERVDQNK